MTTILQRILDHKQTELPSLKAAAPAFEAIGTVRPSLYETLITAQRLQIIAEMKRASPSKGDISTETNPAEQAALYEEAGAACVSVLTETKYFKGSYADLHAVASEVSIPVLCKDFIIDKVQIDYAKAAGASVVLLIVAALEESELKALYDYAVAAGLEVLVEVHDEAELDIALRIGAKIIGVNNRNLKTFEVDLAHTETIGKLLTKFGREDVAFISESGIWESADAEQVASFGAKAVLVGESLMRSGNVIEALQSLQVELVTA